MTGRILLAVRRFSIAMLCLCSAVPVSASALDTTSGMQSLVDGPLLITKYSFQGDQVRFVEIYNNSNQVVSLGGWSVASVAKSGAPPETVVALHGQLAPGEWVTAGNREVFGGEHPPTFTFSYPLPVELTASPLAALMLLPPEGRYLNHTVTPSITSSTPRLAATPPVFGFQRNTSTSSGSYLTTFMAVESTDTFRPYDDGLYTRPSAVRLQIVEVHANSRVCSPLETFASSPLCFDYVKVYNPPGNTEIDLGELRLRGGTSIARLQASLPAGAYAVMPITLNNSGWVWIEDQYGMEAYSHTQVQYPDSGNYRGQAWSFDGTVWRWTAYPTPYDTANQFTDGLPVNECASLRLSEVGANLKTQFIEVYNASTQPIEIGGCQLRTNRSAEAKHVFDAQQLPSGALIAIDISKTNLALTKTTAGTVYLLSSDGLVEVDAREYGSLSENTSLALVDGVWGQTFAVTPGASNEFAEYPPCQTGYVRNDETGRCNKVVLGAGALADCGVGRERNPETGRCRNIAAASTLTPCKPGQVRNPATNRCRSATLASATLTPCKVGQERNPETNRCRSIASAGATLKSCAKGQERNPETNRCRKVAGATLGATDFPVEPVKDTATAFAGWWALGGVILLGIGYAGWEYRHEVATIIKRVVPKGKS